MGKFQQTVKQSSKDVKYFPALIHIDFNEILQMGMYGKI
jgi:hypothetical protein